VINAISIWTGYHVNLKEHCNKSILYVGTVFSTVWMTRWISEWMYMYIMTMNIYIYIYILNSLFLASFAFWISVRRGAYSFKKEIDNFTGILSGGRRWIISVTSKEEGRLIDFLCIPLHYWLYRAKKERDVVGRWMESGHNCCIIV
jgi:hypothetical protein